MIFAEFVSPYPATLSFGSNAFHPSNLRITKEGIVSQECRVLSPLSWKYARVKNSFQKVKFFVKGSEYKLLGVFPCQRHLFGTVPTYEQMRDGKEAYPVFLLGSDNLGRDLFSRIVYGSRISLTIGFVASAISLFLALLFGGIAGYYGGMSDWTVMRLAEFFMLIPGLYLILFLRSLLNTQLDSGKAYMIITLILSLVGWTGSARTIRGMVHSIKREEFVMNANLEGIPSSVIIFKHIIRQMSSLLIVSIALSVPGFIMSETTLSYLGLGIADPAVSWGSLINRDISTVSNLKNFPWLLTPVFLLLIVTLAFNFVADALRDFFDPYHTVFQKRKLFFLKEKITKARKVLGQDEGVTSKEDVLESNIGFQKNSKDNFLSIENLFVSFEVFRQNKRSVIDAVKGVSFSMKKGEVLGIVGESGSGKSVTTTAIPCLLQENANISGKIFFNGKDVLSLSKEECRHLRGKKIGMIFQEPGRSFDPLQTIGSIFLETFRVSDKNISKEESNKKAKELLQEVGIPDAENRLSSYPHQFSGGQLQRIGIALAISQNPELLIADEPTTALDVTIQAQIISLLMSLQKKRNLSIIFISHDIELVSKISNRIIVMYGGKIMEEITLQKIATSDELKDELKSDEIFPKNEFAQIEKLATHPYTKALLSCQPKFGMHYTSEKLTFVSEKEKQNFA